MRADLCTSSTVMETFKDILSWTINLTDRMHQSFAEWHCFPHWANYWLFFCIPNQKEVWIFNQKFGISCICCRHGRTTALVVAVYVFLSPSLCCTHTLALTPRTSLCECKDIRGRKYADRCHAYVDNFWTITSKGIIFLEYFFSCQKINFGLCCQTSKNYAAKISDHRNLMNYQKEHNTFQDNVLCHFDISDISSVTLSQEHSGGHIQLC